MDRRLEEIIRLNKKLSSKVEMSLPYIIKSLKESKFQNVGRALINFIMKSDSLNHSILSSCINKDIYSAWVISRPMIEHSFRHLYIYMKALKEDSDLVGINYYGVLKSSEDLDSLNKINNYNNVVYPEKTKWITKNERNASIKNRAKEFNIEQIFYFLISNGGKDEMIKGFTKDYLLQRLIEYTNLSSSVHGGPFSDLSLNELNKDEDRLDLVINKYSYESFCFYKNIVENTYLFAYTITADDTIKEFYEEINTLNL